MMFPEFITNLAIILGTDVATAGIFISLVLTMAFIIIGALKNVVIALALGICSLVAFVAVGWLNEWVGAAIAIPLAITVAWYASSVTKTGGGD